MCELVCEAARDLKKYELADRPVEHELIARDDLVPIIQRGCRYWVPSPYILTEYFTVAPQATEQFTASDLATINVRGKSFPKEDLLAQARKAANKPRLPLDAVQAGNILQRSRNGFCEFWSNLRRDVEHPAPLHGGSGSFLYKPGIGLVSGLYNDYFSMDARLVSRKFFDILSIDGKLVNYQYSK